MSTHPDLTSALEEAIPRLPSTVAAEARLTSARRALRRRGYARACGLTTVAVLAGGAVLGVGALATSPATTRLPAPSAPGSAEVPAWAKEHGNHGPTAIAPDGDLWVAPDAELLRSIRNPLDEVKQPGRDIEVSYAVEARMHGRVTWGLLYQTAGKETIGAGWLEEPGQWTHDFDLWVDDATSRLEGRPQFADRLVRFTDGRSEELVAGPGAQIIAQTADVDLAAHRVDQERSAAAEVDFGGDTWFVLAEGPTVEGGSSSQSSGDGQPWSTAYEPEIVGGTDLDGFLEFLAEPSAVSQGDQ